METPAGAIYHVARDGQVIGAFPFPTLAAKFKDGSVKPTDHYLIEGTSDWKLVGELKAQFTEHERQLKVEADRKAAEAKAAKEAAELEAAKRRDSRREEERLRAEAEKLRKEIEAGEAARRLAAASKHKAWKCHTCGGNFTSDGKSASYPDASGDITAFLLLVCAGIAAFISTILSVGLVVIAAGFIVAWGVETGLQKFHSYRPRCPKCSSPYCSNQAE